MTSWLDIAEDSDFSLQNLPFGVVSVSSQGSRCVTRLGDTIVDLSVLEEAGLFDDIDDLAANTFCRDTLNSFIEHERSVWLEVRKKLIDLFQKDSGNNALSSNSALQKACLYTYDSDTAGNSITLHLPIQIGDYTDFYSSREHATNVGIMFRGKENALQPNWLHLPVGYHGRSSTIFLSGTPIHRPCGQLQKDNNDPNQGSLYGPSRLLDFELEIAAVVGGPPNTAGTALTIEQAKNRIFGYMLMNDWSARDIQKWEYVPLGPFTAKNFATTVSPWIIMTAALDDNGYQAATSTGTEQNDPKPLSYLHDPNYSSYDIDLTVAIQTKAQSSPSVICQSNFTNMYWNSAQQLVHHSVSGCIMKAGDLLGSGTISGSQSNSFGSLLELSWKGSKEVAVGNEVRKFLQDGDTVVMTGLCSKNGQSRIGFGECNGTILPAQTNTPSSAAIQRKTEERYRDFKLYGYWRSSSTWRVRVALIAKGIQYATIPINIVKGEQRAQDYLNKNPLGQVPLLEVTDSETGKVLYISQSIAIFEFLDAIFPNRRSLIPTQPAERAAAWEMVEVINAGTQPLQNVIYLKELEERTNGAIKALEEAKKVNERGLRALETLVQRRTEEVSGPFALGTFSPTIVDACLVPQMANSRRFEVDIDTVCPLLKKIEVACLNHCWFKDSHPNVQPDAES